MDYISQFSEFYKYLLFFITTTIEGPTTSIIGASLSSTGFFRIEIIFGLALLGDVFADVVFYCVGRFFVGNSFFKKYTKFINQIGFLSKKVQKKPFLYLFIVKFTPYLGVPGLIFAGFHKMKFSKFFLYSTLISIAVKTVFVSIGYFGGIGIDKVSSFFDIWTKIVFWIVFIVVLIFFVRFVLSRIGKSIDDKKENL